MGAVPARTCFLCCVKLGLIRLVPGCVLAGQKPRDPCSNRNCGHPRFGVVVVGERAVDQVELLLELGRQRADVGLVESAIFQAVRARVAVRGQPQNLLPLPAVLMFNAIGSLSRRVVRT